MQEQVRKSFQAGAPPSLIFTLMILTNVLINLDHGILPACTTQMQERLDMDEAELGILGSIVYLGISIMGMFAGRIYQHFSSKIVTLVALLVLQASLLIFVFMDNKFMAYASRFMTGVCQVFLLVYYPIWIDKFGKDKKTLWLTLLQICVPVGIFIGYGITAVIISTGNHYNLSFYIQVGLVAAFIAAFFSLSKRKLDSRRRLSEDLTDSLENPINPMMNDQEINQKQKYKFSYMICKLAKSKMYLVGTFTMAVILYVSTGIQFWLTKYFTDVLKFDSDQVYIAYAVVSITGPTTGCAFGGYIVNKKGGYENPRTIYYVFIFASIGIGSAVIIPFVDNFYFICILLWLVLYFGGAMMPGLTGIMMCSVSPYLRAFGNSTGQIIKNMFGYFPSPFVYGLFNTLLGDRAGIKFLMFWGLWAPVLLAYGSFHIYKKLKKIQQLKISKVIAEDVQEEVLYSDEQSESKEELQDEPVVVNEQNPEFSGEKVETVGSINKEEQQEEGKIEDRGTNDTG